MATFVIKPISSNVQRLLLTDPLGDNISVHFNKCLILSKSKFIELAVDNLFYVDNGMLWVALKLDSEFKARKTKNGSTKNKFKFNYNLDYVTSEIHKKLWPDNPSDLLDRVRIVPVIGSKFVQDHVIFVSEDELFNITSTFGLRNHEQIEVTLHTVPSLECAPKIGSLAEVNLLVNDFDLENDFIKEVLRNHFELPKLLNTNDTFTVDLTPEITGKYHYKYYDLVQSIGRLHFKCNKLTSDVQIDSDTIQLKSKLINKNNIDMPYFIVKGVTQLTLGENIHGLKPRYEFYKHESIVKPNMTMVQSCPYGLKKIFDLMQETISPFLEGHLNDILVSLSTPIVPMLLLTGSNGSGKHLLVKTLAKYNGLNCLQIDCNAIQSSTAKQTESKINATIQKAKSASPVIVLLDNFEVFAVDPENNEDCRVIEYFVNTIITLYQNYTKHAIIFVAVTERTDLKPNILRIFLEKFHIPRLSLKERQEMLKWFVTVMQIEFADGNIEKGSKECLDHSFGLDDVMQRLAAKTETFLFGDLDTLIHFALREAYFKGDNESICGTSLCSVKEDHFNSALESMRNLQSQHLDAPKIPKVLWDDIGGLDKLKRELLKTIEFPIKYPHLFKNSSLKRSGILLYGPPGCGKTLVAKAVSTELNVSFLSVKGPELLNMYIGQSEENVRKVFSSARASSPCIVFLDELDALAPRRGAAGDSGGASDRVVSQLLAEVDGVSSEDDADSSSFVFIMGATNRPDLLEQSLLRPGRLDKLIYVGPYCGLEEKTKVLKALCRSHNLRPEVSLEEVAAALPERCTGADLLSVVSVARSAAVRALLDKLRDGQVKESELNTDSVILGVSELWEGVKSFRPSVTEEELLYYESLQTQIHLKRTRSRRLSSPKRRKRRRRALVAAKLRRRSGPKEKFVTS